MSQTKRFYPSEDGGNYRSAWLDCKEWACDLIRVNGGYLAFSVLNEDARKHRGGLE